MLDFGFYNMDCMQGMKEFPDKYFELAIVDPPYGIGASKDVVRHKHNKKDWDIPPTQEYFVELFRVSQNQIIWGGNYFNLPTNRCFVVWDKFISEDFSLAMAEYAWTSFDKLAKIVRMATPKDGGKIHPTQKPVALYEWLLQHYAKQGDKILDTHVGSGSSFIACYNMNFDILGFEIDKDYFDAANKRIEEHKAQIRWDL